MDANPQSVVPASFDEEEAVPALPAATAAAPATTSPAGLAALYDIPVKVEVVLGGARMRIDSLLATAPGSIVELDRRVGEPVDVVVNGRLLARGQLVLVDGALGVTLTELVKREGQ